MKPGEAKITEVDEPIKRPSEAELEARAAYRKTILDFVNTEESTYKKNQKILKEIEDERKRQDPESSDQPFVRSRRASIFESDTLEQPKTTPSARSLLTEQLFAAQQTTQRST